MADQRSFTGTDDLQETMEREVTIPYSILPFLPEFIHPRELATVLQHFNYVVIVDLILDLSNFSQTSCEFELSPNIILVLQTK